MSRREDIDNAIWSDPDFEELSLEATALYLWSWTNQRCGMAGLYKVSKRAMTESKVPVDRLDAVLAELAAARFAYYDEGVLFVRTRVKHLRTRTEQIAKSIARDVGKVGPHHLTDEWLTVYAEAPWPGGHLRAALEAEGLLNVGDVQANVNRGSHSSEEQAEVVNLTRTSPEPHPRFHGNGSGNGSEGGAGGDRRKRVTFNGKAVADDALALAVDLLAEFDRQAGTTHKPYDGIGDPTESLRRIIGAVTRHGDALTAESGPRVIAAGLRDPWWGGGKPDVGVVFGPKVIERNLQRASSSQGGQVDLAARRRALGYDDEASA